MSYSGDNNLIVGNVAANVLPLALKTKIVLFAAKHHGLLASMFGLFSNVETLPVERQKDGYLAMNTQRFKYTEGDKFYIVCSGIYPEPRILPDGAAEVQLITPNYDGNLFARQEQKMARYKTDIIIPKSEIDKVGGKAQAAEDLVNAHFRIHTEGAANKIRRDMWGDTEQTDMTLGGIRRIVNQTANTYLLDGTAHADWNAQAVNQGGALNDLDNVNLLQTQIHNAGGVANVMCGGVNMFSWVRKRLEDVGNLATWFDTLKFGGEVIQYGPSRLCLDSYAPSGELYIFSTDRWYMFSMGGQDIGTWVPEATYLESAGHGVMSFRLGIGCEKRNENGVLYGATAPTN